MTEQDLFAKGLGGSSKPRAYQVPVFGMEAQGSCSGLGSPRCSSSMEMLSGD